MQSVLMQFGTVEELTWPKKCSGCAQDFAEEAMLHTDQQSSQQAHSNIDPKLVQRIRSNMELKDTSELLKIWRENDKGLYSEEAFEVVKQLLMERDKVFVKEGLPPQKEHLPEINQYFEEVGIGKSAGTYFARLKPKSLSVRLCSKCFKRASRFKVMGYVGLVFVLLAFIGPVFLGMRALQQMQGAGASFWFGCLLYWVGESRRKKAIGLKCKRLSKSRWDFWLQNDIFRNEFLKLNSTLVERHSQ